MSRPSAWATKRAIDILGIARPNLCREVAEALDAAHEAGRTEMSNGIADVMQKHLGVEPLFGWEARIVSLGVAILRRERNAHAAGFDAGKEAAAQVCEKYSEEAYDDDSSRAYGAAECATAIRAITLETK